MAAAFRCQPVDYAPMAPAAPCMRKPMETDPQRIVPVQ